MEEARDRGRLPGPSRPPTADRDRCRSQLSRREFAALAATTGVGALAGCDGTVPDDERPGPDDEPDDGPDVELHALGALQPRTETTFQLLVDGNPVEGVVLELEGEPLAETDEDGTVPAEIPYRDRVTVTGEVPLPGRASSDGGDDTDGSGSGGTDTDDSGSDDTGTDDPAPPTERVERTFTVFETPDHSGAGYERRWFETTQSAAPVADVQYNPHVPEGQHPAMDGLFAPYATYDRETGVFHPGLVEAVEHEHGAMVARLREDVTWQTGEPVDADALVFQWEILLATDHVATAVLTDVEASGEYEVRFGYEPGTDRRLVEHAVLHERADHPPADWQPVHDGALEPTELVVDEPTSSGPLALLEATDEYRAYVPRGRLAGHDDHPAGGHYNWHGYRVSYAEMRQDVYETLIDASVDGVQSLPASETAYDQFAPEYGQFGSSAASGIRLDFDHRDAPFAERALRQAVAHSIDLSGVSLAVGEATARAPRLQTGLFDPAASDWLEGRSDDFQQYERDEDRVEALAAEAGVDRDALEVELVAPAGRPRLVLAATSVEEQLRQHGWTVRLRTYGGSFEDVLAAGDFDLAVTAVGGDPHHVAPFVALREALLAPAGRTARTAGYEPPEDAAVEATLRDLRTEPDRDRRAELVRELALLVNRDLPALLLAQDRELHFVDLEMWTVPRDSGHLRTGAPLWQLPFVEERFDDDYRDWAPGLLKADGERRSPRDAGPADLPVEDPSHRVLNGTER